MGSSREAWKICDVLRELRPASAATALAAVVLAAPTASSDGPETTKGVFFVRKRNRNQVHYGIHVDASCTPVGATPVFGYWRMLEHGPLRDRKPATLARDPAYGSPNKILDQGDAGGRVGIRLRALGCFHRDHDRIPRRRLRGSCHHRHRRCPGLCPTCAYLRWPFGVDYLPCRAARSRMGASFGSGCSHAETDERRRSSSASRGRVAPGERLAIPVGVGPRLVDRRETERGRARIQRLLVGDEPRALLWLALPMAAGPRDRPVAPGRDLGRLHAPGRAITEAPC